MDDNAMIVLRAFGGLDKEAACSASSSKDGREKLYRLRYGKKASIMKEALSKVSNDSDEGAEVEVTHLDKSAKLAALAALDAMKKDPQQLRPSGVTNGKVAEVGLLRSKVRSDKEKQKETEALGNMMGPKMAADGQNGQPDPYAAFEQMQRDGAVVSKAIPGIDPSIVMQGQQQGVDMTPGGIKKRLGAHEMIAKGKKILADENKNGIPDIAEGQAGPEGGAAAVQQPAQMIAAAKLRMPDLTKMSLAEHAEEEDAGTESAAEEREEKMDPEIVQKLLNLIVEKGDSIDDEKDFHAKTDELGVNTHEAEEQIYKTLAGLMGGKNDVIPGGLAAGMPTEDFPKDQLDKARQVEAEHSSNPVIDTEIGKDHLVESEDYYEPRLDDLEKNMDKDKEEGKTKGVNEDTEQGKKNIARKKKDVEKAKASEKKAALARWAQSWVKSSSPTAQNTEDDDEGNEVEPGVVYLASASDTPPKPAPKLKPEEESENEADTTLEESEEKKADVVYLASNSDTPPSISPKAQPEEESENAEEDEDEDEDEDEGEEKKADMGGGAAPMESSSDLPRREGFKTTSRQDVFNDLSRWSLGARM